MTTNNVDNQKIAQLEQQLQRAQAQLLELNQRVSFLERENNRRRQDVTTLAQRKG
jgi:replication fork clamp-binding protein CrfC